MHRTAAALALLACVAAPAPARAAWSESGFVVDDYMGSIGARAVLLRRAANGDLFLLIGAQGASFDYEAQRVLAAGGVAPGWGIGAVWIEGGGTETSHTQSIVPDESGGLFHAGYFDCSTPDSIGLQHVRPDGVLEPSGTQGPCGLKYWRVSAASVGEGLDAASDGAGGVYISWSRAGRLRLQRRLVDGTVAAGWSAFGRNVASLGGSFVAPDVEPDGAGGAVLFWNDNRPRAIRILPDTTLAVGWSAAGLELGTNTPDIGISSWDLPKLLPSGPDHWIAVWREVPASGVVRVVAQRFGLDGTLDPAWPAAGFEVVAPASGITLTTAIGDGQDGLHLLWNSNLAPRWTHLLASGAFAPGHSAAGRSPIDDAAVYQSSSFKLVGAPANDGGLIFLWRDLRASQPGIRARWLLSNGSPDPGEPDSGRVIPIASKNGVKAACPDGLGGVYVAWEVWTSQYDSDLYMGRLLPSRLVDVPPAPARTTRGLALRVPDPNPARNGFDVRFVLPDDAPARLELFDVSGRLLRALDVRGFGEGVARFERIGDLRAGLYFVRLSHESERRWTRVAIVP